MMRKRFFIRLFVIATVCLGLQSCLEQTLELTKIKLSVTVDESAVVEKEDQRQAVIKDDMGSKIVIQRLDRSQVSDTEIGKLVLSTGEKKGLQLKQMKTKPIMGSSVTGSYVYATRKDSLYVIAGFVGDDSTDGYLMTVTGDKDLDYTVFNVVQTASYMK